MGAKKPMAIIMICAFLLSACVTGGTGSSGFSVGPVVSSSYSKPVIKAAPVVQKARLDIIVPMFDLGLPKDPKKYKKAGIWPELRRAEASRFAYKMKLALENTGVFGAVRVMPDKTATGDLYVLGTIDESNGANVAINIKVYDISGKRWFDKSFKHEVAKDFYSNIRNKEKDPYDPVFKQAASKLVEALDHHSNQQLDNLKAITDLRFGASFSEKTFSPYMQQKKGIVSLVSYPDKNDVMLNRIKAIRIRDQLFTDSMQPHYAQFSQKMDDSYRLWQQQSSTEYEAEQDSKRETIGNAVAGVALIGLSVLSAIMGGQSNSYGGYTAGTTGAVIGGMVGAKLLNKSFQSNEQAKFHREALSELGQSIDGEMAPQVVQFEKSTLKLTGNAKQQFSQWRKFLKKIFAEEATPNVQL
ncbi:MAG: hypothetical protein Q9M14_07485 [Mariprofundaceae bacterium]|nr:hypothetical protein [Mariprofundaceae bacterium]